MRHNFDPIATEQPIYHMHASVPSHPSRNCIHSLRVPFLLRHPALRITPDSRRMYAHGFHLTGKNVAPSAFYTDDVMSPQVERKNDGRRRPVHHLTDALFPAAIVGQFRPMPSAILSPSLSMCLWSRIGPLRHPSNGRRGDSGGVMPSQTSGSGCGRRFSLFWS